MKLIVLCGPPAAGKLTIAQELSKITGYKVFHNHLTVDLYDSVFGYGSEVFWRLVNETRLKVFEEAAKNDISLIFTLVYAKGDDDEFIRQVIESVEGHGEEVFFVQLTPSKDELRRRVVDETRQKFNKISSVEGLDRMMEKYDLFSPITGVDSLRLDNTDMPPQKAAETIVKHFKLGI